MAAVTEPTAAIVTAEVTLAAADSLVPVARALLAVVQVAAAVASAAAAMVPAAQVQHLRLQYWPWLCRRHSLPLQRWLWPLSLLLMRLSLRQLPRLLLLLQLRLPSRTPLLLRRRLPWLPLYLGIIPCRAGRGGPIQLGLSPLYRKTYQMSLRSKQQNELPPYLGLRVSHPELMQERPELPLHHKHPIRLKRPKTQATAPDSEFPVLH